MRKFHGADEISEYLSEQVDNFESMVIEKKMISIGYLPADFNSTVLAQNPKPTSLALAPIYMMPGSIRYGFAFSFTQF